MYLHKDNDDVDMDVDDPTDKNRFCCKVEFIV